MKRSLAFAAVLAVLGLGTDAHAHVGSPAAVEDGRAGPYHVLVTIRPPEVVPGIAQIDVRAFDPDVASVTVVPLPLNGPGANSPPVADVAQRSVEDPQLYSSTSWLMRTGAWQIRVTANGARGTGVLSIPIPALARTTRPMPRYLGAMLVGLLALLVAGLVAIVGAGLRDADLDRGATPDARRLRRGRIAMLVTGAILALAIFGGRRWWNGEAALYRRLVYRPMQVTVERPTPDAWSLALADPGWLRWRQTDDLVADHGHLMHLFAVRAPGLDAIAHLHPRRTGEAAFAQAVPPLPDGSYRMFGDIVHETGLDETVTAAVDLSAAPPAPSELGGSRFDPDDAAAILPHAASLAEPAFTFPQGGRLVWADARAPRAGETVVLAFEAQDGDGRPAAGIEPYMGMAGHAMIVARDFSVFAHVHPTGSVPMAAMALIDGAAAVDHAHHQGMTFAPRVRFPCLFPKPGDYRVFVQIKEGGRVETAAYDISVTPAASPRRT